MNFFGHATIALWSTDDPAHVFGAMVPDFAGMVGTSVAHALDHTGLQGGIDLHHRTDDAFHGAPIFIDLCRVALQQMESIGVSRASARAVAHVGTELLLDGWLASNDAAVSAYRAAMVEGPSLIRAISFRSDDGASRCQWLLSRLAPAPVPHRYNETEFVAERLVFALASRPRLALSSEDAARVRRLLPEIQARVTLAAPSLIESVRQRLGSPTDH